MALGALAALSLVAGLLAATDGDGDGFDDSTENFIGTDPGRACNATTTADDEVLDAWPPDFDDDTSVGIAEVAKTRAHYGTASGDGSYNPRYDLTADGRIDVADVVALRSFYGTSCTPVAGEFFLGQYYDNVDFTNLKVTRSDPEIFFDWGNGSPDPSIASDTFSVRWTGQFTFAEGLHRFTARVDDGVRVWIDGVKVLDQWKDQAATTYTFDRSLSAGAHEIVVEYYENGGAAVAQVSWFPVSGPAIGPGTRIPWQGGNWYLHGANLPWYNWGCDFGCQANGGASSAAVQSALRNGFGKLQSADMHVARWWVFPGNPWQVTTDASGAPNGIHPAVYQDFDAALQLAEEFDLYYVFTLFSSPTDVPRAWVTDPAQRTKLAQALGTLFARYSANPRILTWQIFNEPEWRIWNGFIDAPSVQATVREIAASIHANSNAYASVGSAHIGGLPMWVGQGLDYYTAHWYDGMTDSQACAMCTDYQSLKALYNLDAPVVIGEFYAGSDANPQQRLQAWYDKGYAGAFAWSLFSDRTNDHLAIDFAAATAFAGLNRDIGPRSGSPPATSTPTPTATPAPSPPSGFPSDPDLVYFAGDGVANTRVSISGEKFFINGAATYAGKSWNGHLLEGQLLNSRMVLGTYDDMDGNPPSGMLPWDPRKNTEDYIANMDDWRAQGLLGITTNFQGGSNVCNGYSGDGQSGGVNNNPFGPGGRQAFDDWHANRDTAHARYLARMGSVIRTADDLGMVVILGFFYFGQDESLSNEAAVVAAVDAATDWVLANKWTNVIIEINNEANVAYQHAILQPGRVPELIQRVQSRSSGAAGAHLPHGRLLVSTSGGGGYVPPDSWLSSSDFVLLHGNFVDANGIRWMADQVRSRSAWQAKSKPLLFNEDSTNLANFRAAIEKYASWGYYDDSGYQCVYSSSVTNRWTLQKATEPGYWPLVLEMSSGLTPPGSSMVSFTLINADTNQPIATFDPLTSGATLRLSSLPTRNLNIRANTSPSVVGSVRFELDGNTNYKIENAAPYALAGDASGDYAAWTPSTGTHTLKATPYSSSNATGTAGAPLTITFTVTE